MSTTAEATAPERVSCPHCGAAGPGSPFCGACGAHLAHHDRRKAARRLHSYAAFPDEPLFRASVVTHCSRSWPTGQERPSAWLLACLPRHCSLSPWRAQGRRS